MYSSALPFLLYRNRTCWNTFQPTHMNRADCEALHVIVQTPSGKFVVLHLPSASTGYDLGNHITAASGVALQHQLLFCNNRRIDLQKSLQMQGVINGSTIIMNLKLNGGAGKQLSEMHSYWYTVVCDSILHTWFFYS